MREAGFVIATARILRRVWQIYVAHVFLFTIFLAEISYVRDQFREPASTPKKWASWDFLKQPDITIVPGAAVAIPPCQYGCAAALYRADAVPAADPCG